MPHNKVLVTGATGTVGGQVARQLVDAGADVRALARDPDSARLPADVEVVRGDLSAPESLEEPLRDVDTVFLVWPLLTAEGIDNVLAAVQRHARRLVYLSADGVDLDRHNESNPILRFHGDVERAVRASGLEWVCLRPASFASNTVGWASQLREGVVRQPFGSRRQAMIHEADIAAVAVRALLHDDLLESAPVITGPESLTPAEQVAVLSDALDIPARFEEISTADARENAIAAGWPEDFANALFSGDEVEPQHTTTRFAEITGHQPRSLRRWALDHAGDFR